MKTTQEKNSPSRKLAEKGTVQPVLIHLSKEDIPLMKKFSDKQGKTVSQVVREAIKVYIYDQKKSDAYDSGYDDGLLAAIAIVKRTKLDLEKVDDLASEAAAKAIREHVGRWQK